MSRLFFGVLLANLFGEFCVLAGTHVITFPNALIPGIDLDIHVTVVQANESVNIETLLQRVSDNFTMSRATATLTAGIPTVIRLPISGDLERSQYKVVVSGSKGITFTTESAIAFEENCLLMYIQTDKSRYSGGQEVKYRALFMRPNLMPYEGPVTLTVHDGNQHMIKTESFSSAPKGVAKGNLLLGETPVFGIWSVTAVALSLNKSYRKTFVVKDYVLPRFEVKITVPDEVKDTDTSFEISVQARFVFETDVSGNCTIQIYNPASVTNYVEYSKQITGLANFTVQMNAIKYMLSDWKVIVRALVSDNTTLLTMVNEKVLYIASERNENQITIIKVDKRDYFSPGMMYQTPIIVKRQGKQVGSSGILNVKPVVFEYRTCFVNFSYTYLQNTSKADFTVSFDEKGNGFLKFKTERHYHTIEFVFSVGSFTVRALSEGPRITLSSDKGYAKVGEMVAIKADASESLVMLEGLVVFEVFARGMLLHIEKIITNRTSTISFDIIVSADMVPKTYVLATHVTKSGHIVQDYIVLVVDGSPLRNNVSVEINGTSFKPRDSIRLTLKTSPGSTAYILIEDERNRLLGVENDIFAYEVRDKLWSMGHVKNARKRRTTMNDEDSEVNVLTDFQGFTKTPAGNFPIYNSGVPPQCIKKDPCVPQRYSSFKREICSSSSTYLSSINGGSPEQNVGIPVFQEQDQDQLSGGVQEELDLVTQEEDQSSDFIRSLFPETWLWEEYEIGLSGQLDVAKTLPDSITTWVTSVFASDRTTGFGIPEEKYKIKVKRNFFVTMTTPPSLILGEEFLLQITVFNFLGKWIQVAMYIDKSDDPSRPVIEAVVIEGNHSLSTFTKITPQMAGVLKITVRAKAGDFFTTYARDKIEKEVLVRLPGIRKIINHPKVVTVLANDTVNRDVISFGNYSNTVPGSQQVYMTITGDIMTPTISGLQNLIRKPAGCGEQNMIYFAPDVFIVKYLKLLGQLSKENEAIAISHILAGYQNELTYTRNDGSFSRYPRDPCGGTWLTAYILKCFHQAQFLITIDSVILDRATYWLLNRQNYDGSFVECLPVLYIDHVFSQLRLTAFVIVSLVEAKQSSPASMLPRINEVIRKGKTYLEGKLSQINDAYSLSITCYALSICRSQLYQSCFEKLQDRATTQDGMMHWTEVYDTSKATGQARAKDVEATAYGLLTYISIGRHLDALPIIKWLVSQRNSQGGYQTTQDTVIAVQALTEYSINLIRNITYPSRNVQIEAIGPGYAQTYLISDTNYNHTKRLEIPASLSSINVTVSGNGFAVLDVVETFYVSKKEQNHSDIGVSVTILKESVNSLTIRPVLSWKGVSTSNLLMMEIEMPSGFSADVEIIKYQYSIQRHESRGQTFVLYFNSLRSGQQIQVDIKMDRVDPIIGNQMCFITVYDYYEPEKQSFITYESGILKRSNVCSICPQCVMCKGVK